MRTRHRLLLAFCALTTVLVSASPAAAEVVPLSTLGGFGFGAGQLSGPRAVAIGPAGDVFVVEQSNHRVSQFTSAGVFVRAWGADVIPGGPTGFEVCTTATTCQGAVQGPAAGQLNNPIGIAANSAGNLFVAESVNNRISEFTSAGAFVGAWGYDVILGGGAGLEVCTESTTCKAGVQGGAAGQLDQPTGLSIDATGNLYVADQANSSVSQFTTSGDFVRAWGANVIPGGSTGFEVCTVDTTCQVATFGAGPGEMSGPRAAFSDGNGTVFVTDLNNHRINQYTADGAFTRAWGFDVIPGGATGFEICTTACKAGLTGAAAGQLSNPRSVGIDAAGNIFVTESNNNRISEFTGSATFVKAWGFDVIPGGDTGFEVCTEATTCKAGTGGSGVGELGALNQLAVDCRGAIWVASGDRVQRFGEPGTEAPPCPPPPPPPGPPANPVSPSNAFSFGKAKLNKRKGTATLTVEVPGSGELVGEGKAIRPTTGSAAAAGDVTLSIRARGKAKRKLRQDGKAKVTADVTYTPTGGSPNTQSKKLKLKQR